MAGGSWVPEAVRQPVIERWDKAAADRARTLVRRARRRGRPTDVETTVLEELTRAAKRGELSTADRDAIAPLLQAVLADAAGRRAVPPDLVETVCDAFVSLYQPVKDPSPEPAAPIVAAIADQYHRLYYHRAPRTWRNTFYRGHRILKLPMDVWVYQELIHELRPSLIVETGTRYGGSALYMADLLELNGHGRIVTIDIEELEGRPTHPRITHLIGSSTAPEIVDQVRAMLPDDGGHVLLVLDSDHARDHVLGELRAMADLVTVGSYVIVEDTDINGHPVLPEFGPGPMEAVDLFLAEDDRFVPDPAREKYYVTQNPRGYLRRER